MNNGSTANAVHWEESITNDEGSTSASVSSSRSVAPCGSSPMTERTLVGTERAVRARAVCGAQPPAVKVTLEKVVTVSRVSGMLQACSCMSTQLRPQQMTLGDMAGLTWVIIWNVS